jgi:tetratricopeptide (TPR) repeat protein
MTGDHQQAANLRDQALRISRKLGYRDSEARALYGLSDLRRLAGDYPQAIDLQEQALAIFREIGHHRREVWALKELNALRHLAAG